MSICGVSLIEPTGISLMKWGADFGPLTLTGDWWRTVTCNFIHIGIIHLLMNMYALLYIGKSLYRSTVYVCTSGSCASAFWDSVLDALPVHPPIAKRGNNKKGNISFFIFHPPFFLQLPQGLLLNHEAWNCNATSSSVGPEKTYV